LYWQLCITRQHLKSQGLQAITCQDSLCFQNSDADKNKPTYPALLGLEYSKSEFEHLYQQALNSDVNVCIR
jgi:hypothetical protein